MLRFILIFLLFVSFARAQTNCKSGILYSSVDVKSGNYQELNVKKMHHALWSDSIIIKTKKEKITVSPEKIWGYRDKNCVLFRSYEDYFYRVEEADSMVIYTQVLSPFDNYAFTFYYFSKTLDSPILKLTRKNLETEFNKNHCFISRLDKDIKWFEDYTKVDRKKHIYKIIEIYKDCLKK